MNKNLLIVAATELELKLIRKKMDLQDLAVKPHNRFDISLLSTGVGAVNTVWSLMDYKDHYSKPDILLNIGIAGSFNSEISPGDTVLVANDSFADLGLETGDGFIDIFEAGLAEKDDGTFIAGKVFADNNLLNKVGTFYPGVSGITVNTASGNRNTISRLVSRYNADIETMEGAAIYFTATKLAIPALGIRTISNMVEPRNRDNWEIDLALNNLSDAVIRIIQNIDLI